MDGRDVPGSLDFMARANVIRRVLEGIGKGGGENSRTTILPTPLSDALQHAADDVGSGHEIKRARYVAAVHNGLELLDKHSASDLTHQEE